MHIAVAKGWFPGARYTNLRDVRSFDLTNTGFLDIEWRRYNFQTHLAAAKSLRPHLTVARDIEDIFQLEDILCEAEHLNKYAEKVVLVLKDLRLDGLVRNLIPSSFVLGYSVPTRYGGTALPLENFGDRPVHLLGGRPDAQRRLGEHLRVHSLDCNRFTLDAQFGDYFDGETFRPHPVGGYERCIDASLTNINSLWEDYSLAG